MKDGAKIPETGTCMFRSVFNKQNLKNIDWLMMGIVLMIVLFGFIAVTNATSTIDVGEDATFWEVIQSLNFSTSGMQLVFFLIGVVAIAILLLVDYNNLRDFSNIIYWCSVALLLAVLLFGDNNRGVTGWFTIGGFGFQPAELCKVAIIIVLAKEFAKITEGKAEGITKFRELLPIVWRFIIPMVLIMLQPDWGTAIVYMFILVGLMFMAKTSLKIMGICALAFLAMLPIAWLVMEPWQRQRIRIFLDPSLDTTGVGDGMQVSRSKIVASSGGITGKGLFNEDLLTQRSNYLPEQQTDFVFSSTTEAVGFIGALVLILLYMFLVFRMVQLSLRAKDNFGAYIILGVSFMLMFHIFENIGMNIGIMPVTGIPLPMVSAGGSNMLTTMIAIGLVLNVNMRSARRSI